MSIATSDQNVTATETAALVSDRLEIVALFESIKDITGSLACSQLEKNLLLSSFEQKYKNRLSMLSPAVANYAKGEYFVSIIGRFSSGKSTLINALLGIDILPAEVDETTSVVTEIKYGKSRELLIHYDSGESRPIAFDKKELFQYLCKKGTHYREGIKKIIVSSPSEVLKNGITIIDTPGLGSVSDLNNQMAKGVLNNSSAIIMTIYEVDGAANIETIKEIFRWNEYINSPIIFTVTMKDIRRDEAGAINAVREMINQAKVGLRPDIADPPICLISSLQELIYRQFQSGDLSLRQILSENEKMSLRNKNDILKLHGKSGFESFYETLHRTILRRKQIIGLLFAVLEIVRGMNDELEDCSDKLQHYEDVEKLEQELTAEDAAIQEIEEQGKAVVLKLEQEMEALSRTYKKDKLNDLDGRIFRQMVDYMEHEPYEEWADDNFKKLREELINVLMREKREFAYGFRQEIEELRSTTLEDLDHLIQQATERALLEMAPIAQKESSMHIDSIKIHSNNWAKAVFASINTIPTAAAGGFALGELFSQGIGGLVGSAVFGAVGLMSSIIIHKAKGADSEPERMESIKESIRAFLKKQHNQYKKAITRTAKARSQYCEALRKQLPEIRKEVAIKHENTRSLYNSTKETVDDNVAAIEKDLRTITLVLKNIAVLLDKHKGDATVLS